MNKEQAIKHKEVIKWWLENTSKGVFKKLDIEDAEWQFDNTPEFNVHTIYIQNDEYVEFRKAEHDGMQLEFKDTEFSTDKNVWVNFSFKDSGTPFYKHTLIRIKSQFKVGDWIVGKKSNKVQLFTEELKATFDDIAYQYQELWKPKKGELCVVYDNADEYFIGRYGERLLYSTYGAIGEITDMYDENDWNNIAPLEFIDTLKDK